MKRTILALHGHHGVGKDTIADQLVQDGSFVKLAFADNLYDAVSRATGTTIEYLKTREVKNTPQDALANFHLADPSYRRFLTHGQKQDLLEPRTSRYHLQKFGTEWMSRINPNHWVNQLLGALSLRTGDVVIPDLRSYKDLREYSGLKTFAALNSYRLVIVKVVRNGCEANGNEADEPLPDYAIDHTVFNNTEDGADDAVVGIYRILDGEEAFEITNRPNKN